jgi:8-oxo-dGTP diphosphatase
MSNLELVYPENMLSHLRFRFCPMCASPLQRALVNSDGLLHPVCPSCGWVHFPSSALGVVVIVHHNGGIVALLPYSAPAETPAALPAGYCEYGEAPEEAARREVLEKTGLEIEMIRCLGTSFSKQSEYPGPNLTFMFEARSVGGRLRDSEEAGTTVFPIELFPAITPQRRGSRRAWQAYLAYLED